MREKFLNAKHWQIFLITFAIPFFLQIIMVPVLLLTEIPSIMLFVMPVVVLLYLGSFMGWVWSMAIGFHDQIPLNVILSVKRFKYFFFFPVIYLPLLVVAIIYFAGYLAGSGAAPTFFSIGLLFTVITPLHLFSMFCMFYCLYFVSKTIKTVELQREVTFSDYAGEFFLLWFYPVGVWFIQPKVNELTKKNKLI